MKTIKEFVSQIISGDNIGARETFHSLVAEKSMEALAGRKQEIAQTLFQTESREEDLDEETYHVINKKSRMPGTVSSRAGQNIAGVTIKDKYRDRKEAEAHAKHLDKHGSSEGHEVSTWINGKLQEEVDLDEALKYDPNSKGDFQHGETKKWFTYKDADHPWAKEHKLPHQIYVGPNAEETRFGHVKGSVAHVAVDENPDGTPKMEKWSIKNHSKHVREEVEQIDEISKEAKKRYLGTAVGDLTNRAYNHGFETAGPYYLRKDSADGERKIKNRQVGIHRATKEEVELDEENVPYPGHRFHKMDLKSLRHIVNGNVAADKNTVEKAKQIHAYRTQVREEVDLEEGNAENKEKKNRHFDKMGANWKKLNPQHDFTQNDRNLGRGINTYGNKKQVKAAQQAEEVEDIEESGGIRRTMKQLRHELKKSDGSVNPAVVHAANKAYYKQKDSKNRARHSDMPED